jgi:hypothetical protein
MRNANRILVGNPEGKRPLRRRRSRCEEIVKMDLKGTACENVDWTSLNQDRDR